MTEEPGVKPRGRAGLPPAKVKGTAFDIILFFSGLYAWSTTLLPVLLQKPPLPWWSLAAAFLCLGSLIAGMLLKQTRLRALLGIDLCLGSALVCWLGGAASHSSLVATFGGIAWVIFTLAWGLIDAPLQRNSKIGEQLSPRRKMRSFPVIFQALTTLVCVWLLSLPAVIPRNGARGLAVLVVLFCAIALQFSSSQLGSRLQHPERILAKKQTKAYLLPLLALGGVILLIIRQY